MKRLLLLIIAGCWMLGGSICSACITSVQSFNISCQNQFCQQTVTITVPGAEGYYGAFSNDGYVSCCGQNIGTIVSIYPGCREVGFTPSAKPNRDEQRYVQVANLLIPDCHGRFVFYDGSQGILKLNLPALNKRSAR